MPHSHTQPFGVQRACPTLDKLSAYKEDALSFIAREQVRLHLASCDFCGAALQLLSRHVPPVEPVFPPETQTRVPLHVFLLACHLLPRARCDGRTSGRRVA